jgi:hypothetical protein
VFRTTQHQEAWRLVSSILLAFLLTSALFVAPFVATHGDFAHTHPEDTPRHVHSVSGMLSVTLTAAPLELVAVAVVLYTLSLLRSSSLLSGPVAGANGIRAPPGAIL